MANPVYPDDPTEYMQAMAAIMIVGTNVGAGSVYIERQPAVATAVFPVLVLNAPEVSEVVVGIGGPEYQSTFTVFALLIDRPDETGTVLVSTIQAAVKETLYLMKRNIRANMTLGFESTQASLATRVRMNAPLVDVGLGMPAISGYAQFTVKSGYYF